VGLEMNNPETKIPKIPKILSEIFQTNSKTTHFLLIRT